MYVVHFLESSFIAGTVASTFGGGRFLSFIAASGRSNYILHVSAHGKESAKKWTEDLEKNRREPCCHIRLDRAFGIFLLIYLLY